MVIYKEAKDFTKEDYNIIMGTNFEAGYHLSQIAYPLLKSSQNGNIIFVSSIAGFSALPSLSLYSASKGKSLRDIFRILKLTFMLVNQTLFCFI